MCNHKGYQTYEREGETYIASYDYGHPHPQTVIYLICTSCGHTCGVRLR